MSTGPKRSRGALEVENNYYVVRNGLLFEYYPFSVKPYSEKDKFIQFEISPGIKAPGVAILENNLYDVSLEDLFRRRINVGKRQVHRTDDNVGTTTKTEESRRAKEDSNESGFGKLFGDEVSKVADMAWENQVESLLQVISTQEGEEFEITGTTQSGRTDAGSTIPHTIENS